MVSVLAIYSVDASSNPAEVYSLNSVNCSKIKKINEKRPVKVEFGWMDLQPIALFFTYDFLSN